MFSLDHTKAWRLLEPHMEISSRKFNIGEMDVTYRMQSSEGRSVLGQSRFIASEAAEADKSKE